MVIKNNDILFKVKFLLYKVVIIIDFREENLKIEQS